MKTPNLEMPYGAKRCATAIISMFHFPDDEFHGILITIGGQAVYFVFRRIIVLRPLSYFNTMLATHNMPNLSIIRPVYRQQWWRKSCLHSYCQCPPARILHAHSAPGQLNSLRKFSINGWPCFRCTLALYRIKTTNMHQTGNVFSLESGADSTSNSRQDTARYEYAELIRSFCLRIFTVNMFWRYVKARGSRDAVRQQL